jgi:energy-converting hydrogenase Eha subunit A
MKPTLNDKLIAYVTLLSGLAISGVAEYYSIMGLIAIYPAAFIPIVIMGVVLGLGKISGTIWLKQNWEWSPFFLKAYVLPAILVLMMITSLGVFGFLSKAHSDQSLVSGDVQSKVAVYDEKIKTEKENIEANRKALKQMDEGVDQVLGRSADEKGADKAVALRRAQQKERSRLQNEISQSQKSIAELNDARAPIAAEVRKVEAEVGPIKYIAHLLYGENPDANVLERAVIWVTVLIVIVLDPLAVVLLLASQYSFQRFREQDEESAEGDSPIGPVVDIVSPDTTVTSYEGVVAQEVAEVLPEAVNTDFEGIRTPGEEWIQTGPNFDTVTADDTTYIVQPPIFRNRIFKKTQEGYVQNEEQSSSNLWAKIVGKNNEV